jgi:hypothetical protein
MRWWVIVISAIGAVASILAVIVAISSVRNHDDVERIKTALKLQTNCANIAVEHPSRAPVVKQWAGSATQTADVRCVATNASLVYAKFSDHDSLERSLATHPPSSRYCVLGSAIVIDRLVSVPSTVMSDTCQSIGGTLMASSG